MIRRANKNDIPRINELLRQVCSVHAQGRPDIFIDGTRKYSDEELAALFEDDSRPVFVYTDDNDTALAHAFCLYEEIKGVSNMHDMKTLYIDDICVDETARGQHIATALYEYVKQFAKDNDCYRITLNVWEINPTARKFYEKMGLLPLKTTMEAIL